MVGRGIRDTNWNARAPSYHSRWSSLDRLLLAGSGNNRKRVILLQRQINENFCERKWQVALHSWPLYPAPVKLKNMENRTCLECGEALKGRSDKKFCSDYCRNSYNNRVNRDSKNLIRNVNNRLRKNYRILSELNSSGKTKVTRSRLLEKNFDLSLFTSIYTTKSGNVYFYVYDQGYLELENDFFLLIRKD